MVNINMTTDHMKKNDITIITTPLTFGNLTLHCVYNIYVMWKWNFEHADSVCQEMDMQVKIMPHTILFKILFLYIWRFTSDIDVCLLQMCLSLFSTFSLSA